MPRPYTLNAIVHNGGCALCAEIDGQMVGFCFGFPAKRGDEIWLWSHMAGVRPEFQSKGIGFKLKQAQRQWALDQGYEIMGWTFDPLQRGNANFNFNKLGTTAKKYYINHYGEMKDSINAGLASDRLETIWQLNDPHVVRLAKGTVDDLQPRSFSDDQFLVQVDMDDAIHFELPSNWAYDEYCIEIPYNVASLKQKQY